MFTPIPFVFSVAIIVYLTYLELTLYEYLDKKQLLQKPSEQERLLSEIPKVIAEKLEPEVMPDALQMVEDGNISPTSEKGISNLNGTYAIVEYAI